MSPNTGSMPVPMLAPAPAPTPAPAPAPELSSKLLHSWYDHEDERCISGVVQGEDLGYDIHTITGARPSIYKEILQGLEDMKLACMWNESEWRDYVYDRRSYSYSSYTNSCASDVTDSDVYSLCEWSDGSDRSDAASVTSGTSEAQANARAQNPTQTQTQAQASNQQTIAASPDTADAFMHLYKGYQKYAYY